MAADAGLTSDKLALRQNSLLVVNLFDLRRWDAREAILTNTPNTDDLGIITGAFGAGPPQVQTGDLKALGSTTRRAGIVLALPDNYDDAETVKIRCVAGMLTTVADTAATIDVEAYQLNDDGTLSADLCTTAAQSINSLTFEALDFAINAATLVAGSRLDVRLSILVNDAATVTVVKGVLQSLILLADLRP
jgi:hypothetical protein